MKTIVESTIPISHTEFYSLFIADSAKEMQMQIYERKEATNVEISQWKNGPNGQHSQIRTITSIQPINTSDGRITTRTQTQQFCQLKTNSLIVGTIYNQLDSHDYYTTEYRMIVKSISTTESVITYQANIVMKKKGEEKEKDLLFKFEKECRDNVSLFIELYEKEKKKEEQKNVNIIKRVGSHVVELSFKEKMMALQNLLLALIFLALFGILLKL